jgi:hypothetical protein
MKNCFYKVTIREGMLRDTFQSARCGDVVYTPGKWTKAPIGTKLFVFKTFKQAFEFANSEEIIHECRVKHPYKAEWSAASHCDIISFWWRYNTASFPNSWLRLQKNPEGTYFASEVKLENRKWKVQRSGCCGSEKNAIEIDTASE